MADSAPVVHIGENSPEEVAYKLLGHIARAEGKRLAVSVGQEAAADRKYVLDTFAECLRTVRDPAGRTRGTHTDS